MEGQGALCPPRKDDGVQNQYELKNDEQRDEKNDEERSREDKKRITEKHEDVNEKK